MKNKPNIIQSQQKDRQKSLDIKAFSDVPEKKLILLNSLIKYANKYSVVHPTQETLCWDADVTRQTINRWCFDFVDLGWIDMKHRRDPDDPYHRSLTNIYFLNKIFFNTEFRKSLEHLLPALKIIPLLMILSTSMTHILKSNYINKCDNVTNVKKTIKPKKLLWEFQDRWREFHYGGERPPTKQLNFDEHLMLLHRNVPMDYVRREAEKEHRVQFTQQELKALAEGFRKESLDYAMMIVKEDIAHGKQISNLFSYVAGICSRYEERNPKTGRTGAPVHNKPLPSSVQNHESDFQAALNYETTFHDNYTRDKRAWEFCRAFSNPFIKFLSEEEQQRVMGVHQECTCRTIPVYGIKQRTQPPESQLPPQKIDSFDEQYNPLVDAMYEGYEECLD